MIIPIEIILIIFLFDGYVDSQSKTSNNQLRRHSIVYRRILSAMEQNQVIPDVIDTVPPQIVRVRYPNGVEVNLGNELTPTLVKDEPSVEWPIEPNTYYTLVMTDPDAPTRSAPSYAQMKHWLVMNIPGNQISSGETLAEYRGSGPSKDTGLHRYIYLVYKQNGILNTESEIRVKTNSRKGRPLFNVRKFAEQYGLGEPIAGNFYVAEYDDYVEIQRSKTLVEPDFIKLTLANRQ